MKYKNVNEDEQFILDPEELQSLMDKYHEEMAKPKPERDTAFCEKTQMFFIKLMEGFVFKEAQHFKNPKHDTSDMIQEANTCIIEELNGYEPLKNKQKQFCRPLTYFGNRIRGSMQKLACPVVITPHFNNILREVRRTCAKYGIPYSFSEEVVDKVSKITGINPLSIRKAMELGEITINSLDVMDYNQSDEFQSPERACQIKGVREELASALNELTLVERFVFESLALTNKKQSQLATEINMNLDKFNLTRPVKVTNIQTYYNSAREKLMNNANLKKDIRVSSKFKVSTINNEAAPRHVSFLTAVQ